MAEHSKQYATVQEDRTRYQNFQNSIQRIAKLNDRAQKSGSTARYALNKFSDLSPDEFRGFYHKDPVKVDTSVPRTNVMKLESAAPPPNKFDWRPLGAVTAVKNQEQCGSCWAFSTTENIESVWMLKHGVTNSSMKPLSPQQIVDCDNSDGGCNGGNPPTAYEYVISAGGMEDNADYPYKAVNQNCQFNAAKVVAKIASWQYACSYWEESTLQSNLYNHAPPSICVDAANWQDYQGGVMTGWECAWVNMLDHCVQAVGYDLTASTPFWIVRNSWGTGWGENGYIRLEYGVNACGLTNEASSAFC
jgi:cathepsin F